MRSFKCSILDRKGFEVFREGADAGVTRSALIWVDKSVDEFLRLTSAVAIDGTSESES